MGLLIDSSVIVALERAKEPPAQLKVKTAEVPTYLSAVTASELLHGLHRANTEQRRERRSQFLAEVFDLFEILAFDLDVARQHARIWAELSQQGQLIGAHDLMIAATAVHHGLSVVTYNEREFRRVNGLELTTWSRD